MRFENLRFAFFVSAESTKPGRGWSSYTREHLLRINPVFPVLPFLLTPAPNATKPARGGCSQRDQPLVRFEHQRQVLYPENAGGGWR